jgi:acetamidase/formamidase
MSSSPVNLRKGRTISWPRVERADFIVTLGATPGALERAFREAISEMAGWLQADYGLSQREAHTLIHMTAQLRVASWFGTSA